MSLQIRDSLGTLFHVAGKATVDSALSATSKNPVMNKAVYHALQTKIEKTVSDLINYYTKSQTYTKSEVDSLVSAISSLTIEVVTELPTTDISSTTIYFVGPRTGTTIYDQYVFVNNDWVALGSTDIDLSGYVTTEDLGAAFEALTIADLFDVSILDPKDGQTLVYDAALGKWINSDSSFAVDHLDDIKDVDLTNIQNGQTVVWNEVLQKWVNHDSGKIYTADFGIEITDDDKIKTTDFVGSQAEWDSLNTAEKAKFDFINITDDTEEVPGGAPGHVLADENGEKTQRSKLEFEGFDVTDDSTNDKTKVSAIPYTAGNKIVINDHEINADESVKGVFVGTSSEWNAMSFVDKAKYEVVNLTDDVSTPSVVVDTVASGNINPVTSNAVASAMGSMFLLENKLFSISIAGNSYQVISIAVSKTGYKAISISGFNFMNNTTWSRCLYLDYGTQTVTIVLNNLSSTAVTVSNAYLSILYVKEF